MTLDRSISRPSSGAPSSRLNVSQPELNTYATCSPRVLPWRDALPKTARNAPWIGVHQISQTSKPYDSSCVTDSLRRHGSPGFSA